MRCSRIAPWPRTWPSACACARCQGPRSSAACKAALAQVALTGLEERKPGQLSGGQQQRVALARALVVEPRVLLCDEPLGALDRKLRQQMQFELKELQKRLGVTLVFVTHDQEEALAMSDRIAVMNRGRVEQVGAPTEIYERPRTRFVADFIGEINIFRGQRVTMDHGAGIAAGNGLGAGAAEHRRRNRRRDLSRSRCGPRKSRSRQRARQMPGARGCRRRARSRAPTSSAAPCCIALPLTAGQRVLAQQPNSGAGPLHPPGQVVTLNWRPADLVMLED